MTTTLAFIGFGHMGRRLARAACDHPEIVPVAAFDPDDAAWRRASEHGLSFVRREGSAEAILDDPSIDLVHVATPPAAHRAAAIAALERGKAVLCEKPLAIALDDGRAIVAAAERHGRCAVNFPFATVPELQQAAASVRDGALGAIARAEILQHFSQWPRTWHDAGAWLAGSAEGGFVREVLSHFVYLVVRTLGAREVVVEAVHLERDARTGVERAVLALLRADGVPVHVAGGVSGGAPDFNQGTIHGARGAVRVRDWSIVEQATADGWTPLTPDPPLTREQRARRQLDALVDLAHGAPTALATPEEALLVQQTIERILA